MSTNQYFLLLYIYIIIKLYISEFNPCHDHPCQHGGTCHFKPHVEIGFECECPDYTTGSLCHSEYMGIITPLHKKQ